MTLSAEVPERQGRITTAGVEPSGSRTMQAHGVNEVSLVVAHSGPFSETGGRVSINSQVYNYSTVVISSDGDDDVEGSFNVLVLESPGLLQAIELDTQVLVDPYAEEFVAWVDLLEQEEAIRCLIPQSLHSVIPEGIRDPNGQEKVSLSWNDLEQTWYVDNVIGARPSFDGTYTRPGTYRDANTPDSVTPPQVVGLVATGAVKAVFLTWTPSTNANVTWYKVYGSTSPNVPETPDYLLGTVQDSRFTAYKVRDTQGMVDLVPGPLNPTTGEYTSDPSYFKVVAEDVDGSGTASAEVIGEPVRVTGPDLVVNSVTSDHLRSNSVTADKFEATMIHTSEQYVGLIHIHPTMGITVPQIGTDDVTHLAADGTGNQFAGAMTVDGGLTSYGKVNMQGQDNFLAGSLKAGTGVSDPQQMPVVSAYHNYVSTGETANIGGYNRRGLCDDVNGTAYVTAESFLNSSSLQIFTKAEGQGYPLFDVQSGWQALGGVTRVGGYYYILCQSTTNANNWRILVYRASDNAYMTSYSTWPTGTNTPPSISGLTGYPSIGKDDLNNVVVAWPAGGKLWTRKIITYGLPNAGSQAGNTLDYGTFAAQDLGGVQIVGSVTYFGIKDIGVQAYTNASTTGSRNASEDFPKNVGALNGIYLATPGGTWDTFTNGKIFTKHSNLSGTWDFAYDWYDNDTGGTGTASTRPSLKRTVAPTKFAYWTIQVPSSPPDDLTSDGANTARLYAAPTGQTLVRQSILPTNPTVGGKVTTLSQSFLALATSGSGPNGLNDFANRGGSLGQFSSTKEVGGSPAWSLTGDGSWRMGHLRGTAEGLNANDFGWALLTLATGYSFTSVAPAFRYLDGVLYFRGFLTRTAGWVANTTYSAVFTMPTWAAPAQFFDTQVAGSAANASGRLRIEGTGSVSVFVGATAPSFFSLGDINPYPIG